LCNALTWKVHGEWMPRHAGAVNVGAVDHNPTSPLPSVLRSIPATAGRAQRFPRTVRTHVTGMVPTRSGRPGFSSPHRPAPLWCRPPPAVVSQERPVGLPQAPLWCEPTAALVTPHPTVGDSAPQPWCRPTRMAVCGELQVLDSGRDSREAGQGDGKLNPACEQRGALPGKPASQALSAESSGCSSIHPSAPSWSCGPHAAAASRWFLRIRLPPLTTHAPGPRRCSHPSSGCPLRRARDAGPPMPTMALPPMPGNAARAFHPFRNA
jgi:hypothetical protein